MCVQYGVPYIGEIEATVQIHVLWLAVDQEGFPHSSLPILMYYLLHFGLIPVDGMLRLRYMYSKAILRVPSAYCLLVFGQPDLEVSLGLSQVHFVTFTAQDLVHDLFFCGICVFTLTSDCFRVGGGLNTALTSRRLHTFSSRSQSPQSRVHEVV